MWNCLFWIFHIGFKTFEIFDILLLFIVSSQTFLIMQRNINEASLYSFVEPALWIMVKLFVLFENWIWLYPFSCSSLTFNGFFFAHVKNYWWVYVKLLFYSFSVDKIFDHLLLLWNMRSCKKLRIWRKLHTMNNSSSQK